MESSSGNILFQLALILLLTGVNAFFASAEMAIVSVNKNKIKRLSEEGNAKAKLLEKLFAKWEEVWREILKKYKIMKNLQQLLRSII